MLRFDESLQHSIDATTIVGKSTSSKSSSRFPTSIAEKAENYVQGRPQPMTNIIDAFGLGCIGYLGVFLYGAEKFV